MNRHLIGFAILVFLAGASYVASQEKTPLEQARALAEQSKEREAFWKYLSVPGGEHGAITLARGKAKEYLEHVRDNAGKAPAPSVKLIEGDLLLVLGRKEEALAAYRAVAAQIGTKDGDGWAKGFMPADYYPVEPPPPSSEIQSARFSRSYHGEGAPFSVGPGSHRDNWLLRRFLALQAWDDAGAEFARIWQVHRRDTRPFVAPQPSREGNRWVERDHVIHPNGFTGLGMLFAVDYAFFLRQRQDAGTGREILLEVLSAINLDRDADTHEVGEVVPEGKPAPFPRRPEARVNIHVPRPRFDFGHHHTAGLTQKEFIRLAHGEYKLAGQEEELLAALNKQIAGGKNPMRRVLAKVRLHQGKEDQALDLELAYLKEAKLDEGVATFRRAEVLQEFQKLDRAAAEYEKLLALPVAKEERIQAIDALLKLYAALGRTEDLLNASLRQFEIEPRWLEDLNWGLTQARDRFTAAQKEERFTAWLKEHKDKAASRGVRANLCWLLGDHDAALRNIMDEIKVMWASIPDRAVIPDQWLTRFKALGPKQHRAFLEAFLQAVPGHPPAAWDLLLLDGKTDGPAAIRVLEGMLNGPRHHDFANPFHLAYRLIRLYEQQSDVEKIRTLATRLLVAMPPFHEVKHAWLLTGRDTSLETSQRVQAFQDCMLALLPHLDRPHDLQTFKAVADKTSDFHIALMRQIARRLQGDKAFPVEMADRYRKVNQVNLQTIGLPEGQRLVTARDDVTAIAAGGEWFGASWGLVRYRYGKDDLEILQVPLGGRVTSFCPTPAGLFVGSEAGVFRLDQADGARPVPVRIPLEQAAIHDAPSGYSTRLVWWRDALWAAGRGVFQFDPKTGEVRHHDAEGPLFLFQGHLWCGTGPYEEKTGAFRKLMEDADWRCLGATSKEIWANIMVSREAGYRPALVDPQTGTLKVLPLQDVPKGETFHITWELLIAGEDAERVWLTGVNTATFIEYRRATGAAHLLPRADNPKADPQTPRVDLDTSRPFSFFAYQAFKGATPMLLPHADERYYHGVKLADGSQLFGQPTHEDRDGQGGLFALDPKTMQWDRLGSPRNQLAYPQINKITVDEQERRVYLCTQNGLFMLSLPDYQVSARFTRRDGLPNDRVNDAVRIGTKLYVACAGKWAPGGLAVIDLPTGLVQRWSTADGLASNWLKALRVEGRKLHILYDHLAEHEVRGAARPIPVKGGSFTAFTFHSSILDTAAGKLAAGDETLPAQPNVYNLPDMPYLGGKVLTDTVQGGKRYLGGTRGLLIQDDPKAKPAAIAVAKIKAAPTKAQQLLADANRRDLTLAKPADLVQALADDNPYYRARAMAFLWQKQAEWPLSSFAPALDKVITDEHFPIRRSAVGLLAHVDTPAATKLLQKALNDASRGLRYSAGLALTRRGQLPSLDVIEELLKVRNEEVAAALAPHADRAHFALLLKYPIHDDDYEPRREIFRALGKSLRKHPEAADLLLKAYDQPPDREQVRFVLGIFREARGPVLPVFLKALESPDRVVRSNAARAAGYSGDPTAVAPLRKALDLESGLSRASVVWALGELKAKDALPELVQLYLDAVHHEESGRGKAFLFAQAQSATRSQYEHLRDLDALKGEWEDLKSTLRPNPIDPRRDEDLLTSDHVLRAVRNIGMVHSQDFCRALAGSKNAGHRAEGAQGLGSGGKDEQAKNLPILRNLRADDSVEARIAASVSLLRLGDDSVQKEILHWLKTGPLVETLNRLAAVEDPRQLDFARERLRDIVAMEGVGDDQRRLAAALLSRK